MPARAFPLFRFPEFPMTIHKRFWLAGLAGLSAFAAHAAPPVETRPVLDPVTAVVGKQAAATMPKTRLDAARMARSARTAKAATAGGASAAGVESLPVSREDITTLVLVPESDGTATVVHGDADGRTARDQETGR